MYKINASEPIFLVEIISREAGQLSVCLAKLQLLALIALKYTVRLAAIEEDIAIILTESTSETLTRCDETEVRFSKLLSLPIVVHAEVTRAGRL